MTGKQGWRTTDSGTTHRRWECMSRKIRLDWLGEYSIYMGMLRIQMRGLIVLVSINLDTKKIKMRIKEKTMNKKLDLHIQLPKGSIIHQESL